MSFIRNILRTREKAHLEDLVARDPSPSVFARLARLYQEEGDLAKARQTAKLGAAKFPENKEVCSLEQELLKLDRDTEIKRLREHVEKYPNARVFSRLAELLRAAGDSQEARRIVVVGMRNYRDNSGLHYVQGLLEADEDRHEEARAQLARAAELDPHNYGALRVLGQVLSVLGKHAEAAEAYGRILKFAPDDGEVKSLQRLALEAAGVAPAGAAAAAAAPAAPRAHPPAADTRVMPLSEILGDMTSELKELVGAPGIDGAVLSDARGQPVAAVLPAGLGEALAAAVAMDLRKAGSPVCGEAGLGALEQVTVETTAGTICVYTLRELSLAVLLAQGAKAGLADLRARAFAQKVLGGQ
jgi:predicted regulator of Ras-like GTPase activity (Roadblock/LC7/MglB family)